MIIYKTTNIVNGKIYVGQDSKNNPDYLGSGKIFVKVIKKYGVENFKKEILEFCDSFESLNEREKYWINELNSQNPNIGYNIALGGSGSPGVKRSLETKIKISKAITGHRSYFQKHTEETIQKIVLFRKGKESPNKGKKTGPLSEAHKEKIRKARKAYEQRKCNN